VKEGEGGSKEGKEACREKSSAWRQNEEGEKYPRHGRKAKRLLSLSVSHSSHFLSLSTKSLTSPFLPWRSLFFSPILAWTPSTVHSDIPLALIPQRTEMAIPPPDIIQPRRHSPERTEKTSQSEKTPSPSSPEGESPSPGRKHTISSSRQRSSSASGDRSSSSSHRRMNKSSSSSSSSNSHRHHRHHHQKAQGHQITPESNLVHRSTSTSAKTRPMHDDTDAGRVIPVIQPALAIDYLGNSWKNEDDIAASWKFMTKQKNDMINGLRLENASWRNWAKQRHQLKTVSPKSLNW